MHKLRDSGFQLCNIKLVKSDYNCLLWYNNYLKSYAQISDINNGKLSINDSMNSLLNCFVSDTVIPLMLDHAYHTADISLLRNIYLWLKDNGEL
jgi:hypothetical protein